MNTGATDTVTERHGLRLLVCAADGPALGSDQDAADLVGAAMGNDADLIVIPVARLDPTFFALGSGVAGQMLQKFVNYRYRVVILGDITTHLTTSAALQALVRESNRGQDAWFLADEAELDAQLAGRRW